MWQLLLVVGLVFSPLAAAMAFLITYEEYRRHRIPKREQLRRALGAAGVTLLFFLVLAVALGGLLSSLVRSP